MQDYKVYEDKFSSGYIGVLKKQKRYQQYLKLILKPGSIRPVKKVPIEHGPGFPNRSDSVYSEKGSRKLPFML